MFYTDRDCIRIDDIVALDPEVQEIAATENIPTEGDSSFVHQAVEEGANFIMSQMQNFAYPYFMPNLALTNPGVFLPAYDSTPGTRIKLGQIVVDSDTTSYASPLKRWLQFLALRNFFRVASNRVINDRYENKKKQYQCEIESTYWPAVKTAGLPICYNPIPCPGALYELNQGTWSASNISTVAGTASGGTYDVAITWQGQQGESAPSQTQSINVDPGSVLEVSIGSLTVPTVSGSQMANWKVYAGLTGQTLYFQGTIPTGTSTYTFASDPVLSGAVVGSGQPKDVALTFLNLFNRA